MPISSPLYPFRGNKREKKERGGEGMKERVKRKRDVEKERGRAMEDEGRGSKGKRRGRR